MKLTAQRDSNFLELKKRHEKLIDNISEENFSTITSNSKNERKTHTNNRAPNNLLVYCPYAISQVDNFQLLNGDITALSIVPVQ